ncbi:hypothetical protein L9F63_028038, partial [Diploptera punctata]
ENFTHKQLKSKMRSWSSDCLLFWFQTQIAENKSKMRSWSSDLTDSENTLPRQLSPDVLSALQGVRFIAQHIKDADKDNE